MSFRITLCFLLFFCSVLYAQEPKYNLPPQVSYRNAKITLNDFTKFECRNLTIGEEELTFTDVYSTQQMTIPLENVNYIRVRTGNEFFKWAGLGGLLMGLISLNNAITYPGSGNDYMLGFTLSGAAVGGIVGLAIPRWKTYYISNL